MKKIYFSLLLISCMVFNNCKAGIYTLQYPICNPVYTDTFVAIPCGDSVNFNNHFYHNSGNYNDTLTSSQGCDSIITLRLASISDTVSQYSGMCAGDSFYFYGRYIHAQGDYDTLVPGQSGCDTLATLSLVIIGSSIPTHIYDTICGGSSIDFNGTTIDTTGTYTAHFNGQYGCDSTVILNLDVITRQLTYSASICSGDSFYFYGRYLYAQGSYDTISQGACDTMVHFTLIVSQPPPPTSVYDTICYGDSIGFNGSFFDSSGTYSIHYSTPSSCDSIVILQLVVKQSLASFSWDSLYGTGALYCCYVFNSMVDTVWCLYSNGVLPLVGGSPPGGTFSGNGVSGNAIDANILFNDNTYTGFDTITYSVAMDGCIATASDILEALVCQGIKSPSVEEAISLYPNPVADVVILQSDWFAANNVTPALYDVTGKKIAAMDFTKQQDKLSLNTSSLSAGIYFIKLNINGSLVVKKFVKVE